MVKKQWEASEGYSCQVMRTRAGNVARVHARDSVSPESEAMLEKLIDAATEHMLSRDTILEGEGSP